MWREDREQFNRLAKQIVRKSLGLWLSCVQTHSHTPGQWGLTFVRIRTPSRRVSVVVCPLPPPVWALYSHPGFHTLVPVFPSPVIGWMRRQMTFVEWGKMSCVHRTVFNRESSISLWNVFHSHFGLPVCLSCLLHVYTHEITSGITIGLRTVCWCML